MTLDVAEGNSGTVGVRSGLGEEVELSTVGRGVEGKRWGRPPHPFVSGGTGREGRVGRGTLDLASFMYPRKKTNPYDVEIVSVGYFFWKQLEIN